MSVHQWISRGLPAALSLLLALPAGAQSFRVQCPTSTITHKAANNNAEPLYLGPTYTPPTTPGTAADYTTGFHSNAVNGAIKCQQIAGGDGYASMADGTQTYMFSFGPLSGLADIANGLPGTQFPSVFNTSATSLAPGDPATTNDPAPGTFSYNGAVGLTPEVVKLETIYDISEGCTASLASCTGVTPNTVTVILNTPSPFNLNDLVVVSGTGSPPAGYDGTWPVSAVNIPNTQFSAGPGQGASQAFQFLAVDNSVSPARAITGLPEITASSTATAGSLAELNGHVDPRQIMDVGVMNGNIPAPLMAIDEDDEFFLTLTNVGMIMRPDLFEQHTVHFHGYPNASAFYDGVPDASVAINIGGSFTYYYLAPDAGTYFWHCHITPPEHLQMGMVGQLYVRPRQNRWSGYLFDGLLAQQGDLRTACNSASDILCSNPLPAGGTSKAGAQNDGKTKYAYNDGDGSTSYDVEYPLQIHGFDPNFHFVGMTFNPEGLTDMKDKYFLLNGRSYPDTVTPGPMETPSTDGVKHFSQPLPSIINIPVGKKALLRISDLDVTEYQTLASLGIPMKVIGYNAKLLRDQAGNNLYYNTNSITLAGGESLDVILDATGYTAGQKFFLYTPNLDHLSNDAENFGGLMTEINITN